MKKLFSARLESLMCFEPTFVVLFDGVVVIKRGCTLKQARALVQRLNTALRACQNEVQ